MIKATELRIGNITNVGIVRAIHHDHVLMDCYVRFDDGKKMGFDSAEEVFVSDTLSYDEFDGEPITEEWLLKFGFIDDKSNGFDLSIIHIEFILSIGFVYYVNGEATNSIIIQYIHQLQNLYFALTGEELTIKS